MSGAARRSTREMARASSGRRGSSAASWSSSRRHWRRAPAGSPCSMARLPAISSARGCEASSASARAMKRRGLAVEPAALREPRRVRVVAPDAGVQRHLAVGDGALEGGLGFGEAVERQLDAAQQRPCPGVIRVVREVPRELVAEGRRLLGGEGSREAPEGARALDGARVADRRVEGEGRRRQRDRRQQRGRGGPAGGRRARHSRRVPPGRGARARRAPLRAGPAGRRPAARSRSSSAQDARSAARLASRGSAQRAAPSGKSSRARTNPSAAAVIPRATSQKPSTRLRPYFGAAVAGAGAGAGAATATVRFFAIASSRILMASCEITMPLLIESSASFGLWK